MKLLSFPITSCEKVILDLRARTMWDRILGRPGKLLSLDDRTVAGRHILSSFKIENWPHSPGAKIDVVEYEGYKFFGVFSIKPPVDGVSICYCDAFEQPPLLPFLSN